MVKVKSDYMVKLKGDKAAHNNKRGRGTEVGVFANLSVIHSKNFCRVLGFCLCLAIVGCGVYGKVLVVEILTFLPLN